VLKLAAGSLITLDKYDGEPVDIMAKNVKVAEGQVVAIGEYFGIRITKLMHKYDEDEEEEETETPVTSSTQTKVTSATTGSKPAIATATSTEKEGTSKTDESSSPSDIQPPPSQSVPEEATWEPSPDYEELDERPDRIVFNKGDAADFADLCVNIARIMGGNSKESLEAMKNAAYNLKIGCSDFTAEEAAQPDFFKKLIVASANKAEKLGFGSDVISEIENSRTRYASNNVLDGSFAVPHSHIISIVLSYEILMEKYKNKIACLDILRKHGGNYFNIFVLHKFISYMRANDV
jgi:hypothetical protein